MRAPVSTLLLGLLLAGCVPSPRPAPGASPGALPGSACTAFVLRAGGRVLLGKNLDWPVGLGAVLVAPRGGTRTAWLPPAADGAAMAGSPGATWSVRHASVTFTQFGAGFPLGGMNEAGLVVEELSYHPARYPGEDGRPTLDELQWIQYQLDRHATVAEVVADDAVRVQRFLFGLHYLVTDASGDAAVIEFLDGRRVAYTGATLPMPALANDSYARLVRYLGSHAGFGGDRIVTDGPESPERFVRAATAVRRLERAGPLPGLVDSAFAVLAGVAQDDTQWSIVYEPGTGSVHYRTRGSSRVRTLSLGQLAGACAAPLATPLVGRRIHDAGEELERWDGARDRRLRTAVVRALGEQMGPDALPMHASRALLGRGIQTAACPPAMR